MGQLGKYTTYVGGSKTAARTLLGTLYPNGPFATMMGDEDAAKKAVYTQATADPGQANPDNFAPEGAATGGGGLQPKGGLQAGDSGMFPQGVNLTFTPVDPNLIPDVSKVAWKNAGDPINGYVPDITSPSKGPHHTDGASKDQKPDAAVLAEVVALATDEDTSGDNLRNPASDGPAIYKANLGVASPPQLGASKLGDSGGNV
jgi:hypothetical protein